MNEQSNHESQIEKLEELLEDVITEVKDKKFWAAIMSLNGSPSTNARNEAMKHKGKTINSNSGQSRDNSTTLRICELPQILIERTVSEQEAQKVAAHLESRLSPQPLSQFHHAQFRAGYTRNAHKRARRTRRDPTIVSEGPWYPRNDRVTRHL